MTIQNDPSCSLPEEVKSGTGSALVRNSLRRSLHPRSDGSDEAFSSILDDPEAIKGFVDYCNFRLDNVDADVFLLLYMYSYGLSS